MTLPVGQRKAYIQAELAELGPDPFRATLIKSGDATDLRAIKGMGLRAELSRLAKATSHLLEVIEARRELEVRHWNLLAERAKALEREILALVVKASSADPSEAGVGVARRMLTR